MHMQVVMYDDNVDVDALHSGANLNPARLTIRGDVMCSSAKLNTGSYLILTQAGA